MAQLDHIVLGSLDLERDGPALEAQFGCPAQGGGRHPGKGSRNLLWGLGDVYLELIAPDPEQAVPAAGLPYGLSSPDTQALLAEGPRLVTWAARSDAAAAEAAGCPAPLGPLTPMSRGALSWLLTIPEDRIPPCGGLVPALIEWPGGGCPPAEAMAAGPMRLVSLVRRPDAAAGAALGALGLAEAVPEGETGGRPLRAVLDTPAGRVVLD